MHSDEVSTRAITYSTGLVCPLRLGCLTRSIVVTMYNACVRVLHVVVALHASLCGISDLS